jgi:hypothetical protein
MRRLAWLVAALALAGCGPALKLSFPAPAPRPATAPSKPICPGGLSADIQAEPPLPAGAGFPAPQDQTAGAAVALYGPWLHELAVWGRAGWARAADAKAYCAPINAKGDAND